MRVVGGNLYAIVDRTSNCDFTALGAVPSVNAALGVRSSLKRANKLSGLHCCIATCDVRSLFYSLQRSSLHSNNATRGDDRLMTAQCQHVFVYARPLWGGGYNIACRKCGEVYGSSETADADFLAGFNPQFACSRQAQISRGPKTSGNRETVLRPAKPRCTSLLLQRFDLKTLRRQSQAAAALLACADPQVPDCC